MRTQSAEAPREAIDNDWASPTHVHGLVLMAATGIGVFLCFKVALPFLSAFAWALALAVLFTPLQVRLENKLKWPSIAAGLSVVVIGLVVVIPLTFAMQNLVVQAAQGVKLIESKLQTGEWRLAVENQPFLQPIAETIQQRLDLPGAINSLSNWLSTIAMSVVKGSVFQGIEFFITFYLLFFFLRDRNRGLDFLRSMSPLSEVEMSRLFTRVTDTIYATIYGTLVVASVQGFLGGVMFWYLGLPAPFEVAQLLSALLYSTYCTLPAKQGGSENEPSASFPGRAMSKAVNVEPLTNAPPRPCYRWPTLLKMRFGEGAATGDRREMSKVSLKLSNNHI